MRRLPLLKAPEILDVPMAVELLTVPLETIDALLKKAELPGRNVDRKWLPTRSAVQRWVESTSEKDLLARAIQPRERHALAAALKTGQVQIKTRA
jgi:hypothetical protein